MKGFIKEVCDVYNDGYSVNIIVIGRARSGKSVLGFYLYDILKNMLGIEGRWSFGLDVSLMKHENSIILMDEIGYDLYRGSKSEYENRDKLYKILLTTQIKHFVFVMTTNFLNEIEILRRFLNYIIVVRRRKNSIYLKIYRVLQDNLRGVVLVKLKYKYKTNIKNILKRYKKYEKEYIVKKQLFVNSLFNKKNRVNINTLDKYLNKDDK